jgi:23S rRNA (uracil1939-C5)-methyltransferase
LNFRHPIRYLKSDLRVSDLLKVDVTDVALGGKAIARHEGRVVFVDRGLPGDRIEARVTRVKPTFAEARLETLESPSPSRVEAPCPHVARCGGCRFQDLDYPSQIAIKERHVREALVHLGGFESPRIAPIRPAPDVFHYRNKMEFSFHPAPDGRPLLGLHERGTFDRVFPIETCLLPSPLTVEIVRLTQEFAAAHAWQAYHPARHTGVVRFLIVRHLPLTDQCAVHLIAASADVPAIEEWARAVRELSPAIKTISLGINDARGNVAFSQREKLLWGNGTITERMLGLEFDVSANAFLQTNSRQAEALYAAVLEAAAPRPTDTVIDLYCGTGTLTLLMARAASKAFGVESVPDSVARAGENARRNGIDNVRFVEGEARRVLREWAIGERPAPGRADVVVVDPPRSGLHPRVVARAAELSPRRLVYVSCNPATLARDLKDFVARGLGLDEVEPFDMFPHTPHIACVARLDGPAT